MTPFERLHPAVQYQVVNDFGWSGLRGLQEAAIEPVLDGADDRGKTVDRDMRLTRRFRIAPDRQQ